MNRRNLLRAAACTTAGLMAGLRPAFAAGAEIEVSPQAPGPAISPHIYGHFIEHLGAVIYDGIWVGRNSKIPNLDGIRRQFVDDMKRIAAPNSRWPGGCFADGYHWRDGIGRGRARARTTSGRTVCRPGWTTPRPTSSAFTSSSVCAASPAPSPTRSEERR